MDGTLQFGARDGVAAVGGPGGAAAAAAVSDPSRASLSDRAYQKIREALMACALRPGHKLILRPLARSLGLSPTPVREALLRLVSEQALTLDDRGSATVPVTDPEGLQELLDMRGDLEARAIERAALFATEAQIDAIEALNQRCVDAIERGDLAEMMTRNLDFHRAICEAGRSRLVLRTLEGLWMRLGPSYAPAIGGKLPPLSRTGYPHQAMVAALRRRDVAAARHAALVDVSGVARLMATTTAAAG